MNFLATFGSFGSAFLIVSFQLWVAFCRMLVHAAEPWLICLLSRYLTAASPATAIEEPRRRPVSASAAPFSAPSADVSPPSLAVSLPSREVSCASVCSAPACWLKNEPTRRAVPARASTPVSLGRSERLPASNS